MGTLAKFITSETKKATDPIILGQWLFFTLYIDALSFVEAARDEACSYEAAASMLPLLVP